MIKDNNISWDGDFLKLVSNGVYAFLLVLHGFFPDMVNEGGVKTIVVLCSLVKLQPICSMEQAAGSSTFI